MVTATANTSEIKMLWKKENNLIKQQINEMYGAGNQLQPEDKFLLIAKLLNFKDNMQ